MKHTPVICFSSECLRLVESSSSVVKVGGRVEQGWMCCWQQSPGTTRRLHRKDATLGSWMLFSALGCCSLLLLKQVL